MPFTPPASFYGLQPGQQPFDRTPQPPADPNDPATYGYQLVGVEPPPTERPPENTPEAFGYRFLGVEEPEDGGGLPDHVKPWYGLARKMYVSVGNRLTDAPGLSPDSTLDYEEIRSELKKVPESERSNFVHAVQLAARENTTAIEQAGTVPRMLYRALEGIERTGESFGGFMAEYTPGVSEETRTQKSFERTVFDMLRNQGRSDTWVGSALEGAAEMAPAMIAGGTAARGASATARSAGLGTRGAALAGGAAGTQFWTTQEAIGNLDQMREEGIPDEYAKPLALVTGELSALVESAQVSNLLPKGLTGQAQRAAQRAFTDVAKTAAKGIAYNTAEEMVQAAIGEAGAAVGQYMTPEDRKQWDKLVDTDLRSRVQRVLETGKESVGPMAILQGGRTAQEAVGVSRAQRATRNWQQGEVSATEAATGRPNLDALRAEVRRGAEWAIDADTDSVISAAELADPSRKQFQAVTGKQIGSLRSRNAFVEGARIVLMDRMASEMQAEQQPAEQPVEQPADTGQAVEPQTGPIPPQQPVSTQTAESVPASQIGPDTAAEQAVTPETDPLESLRGQLLALDPAMPRDAVMQMGEKALRDTINAVIARQSEAATQLPQVEAEETFTDVKQRIDAAQERGDVTMRDVNQGTEDYRGKGGISSEARGRGFQAAFRDSETGEIAVPQVDLGGGKTVPSGVHVFDGLPDSFVTERDQHGDPIALKGSVEAGFLRDGQFYSREEAAREAAAGTASEASQGKTTPETPTSPPGGMPAEAVRFRDAILEAVGDTIATADDQNARLTIARAAKQIAGQRMSDALQQGNVTVARFYDEKDIDSFTESVLSYADRHGLRNRRQQSPSERSTEQQQIAIPGMEQAVAESEQRFPDDRIAQAMVKQYIVDEGGPEQYAEDLRPVLRSVRPVVEDLIRRDGEAPIEAVLDQLEVPPAPRGVTRRTTERATREMIGRFARDVVFPDMADIQTVRGYRIGEPVEDTVSRETGVIERFELDQDGFAEAVLRTPQGEQRAEVEYLERVESESPAQDRANVRLGRTIERGEEVFFRFDDETEARSRNLVSGQDYVGKATQTFEGTGNYVEVRVNGLKYNVPATAIFVPGKSVQTSTPPSTKEGVPAETRLPGQIGVNRQGQPVFEDENGVRSVAEGNVRITESVQMTPTQAGMQPSVNLDERDERFKTVEELGVPQPDVPQPKGLNLLNLKNAAKRIGRKPEELQALAERGAIDSVRTKKGLAFRPDVLDTWREANPAPSTTSVLPSFDAKTFDADSLAELISSKLMERNTPETMPTPKPSRKTSAAPKISYPKWLKRSGKAEFRKQLAASGMDAEKDAGTRDYADMVAWFATYYQQGLSGADMSQPTMHHEQARAAYAAGQRDAKRKTKPTVREKAAEAGQQASDELLKIKRLMQDKKLLSFPAIDPEVIQAIARYTTAKIKQGVYEFAAVVDDFRTAFTDDEMRKVAPYLEYAWDLLREAETSGVLSETGKVTDILKEKPNVETTQAPEGESGRTEPGRDSDPGEVGERSAERDPQDAEERDADRDAESTGRRPGRKDRRNLEERGEAAVPSDAGSRRGTAGDSGRTAGTDRPADRTPEQIADSRRPGSRGGAKGYDYRIDEGDDIQSGGAVTKFNRNIEAIRLLNELDELQRKATPAEQQILAKQTGWGQLFRFFFTDSQLKKLGVYDLQNQDAWIDGSLKALESVDPVVLRTTRSGNQVMFDPDTPDGRRMIELLKALPPKLYQKARSSTRWSHYTDPDIARAMWDWFSDAIGDRRSLRILEPSEGNGIFWGTMPDALLDGAERWGIDMDEISLRSARQLYQNVKHDNRPFQDVPLPDGFFDMIIGNPPFARQTISGQEKDINALKPSLHNYFFLRSARKLRPGGLMAFIVTHHFMDAQDSKIRRHLEEKEGMRLVGAVRLPNNAFGKIAGTSVTTDIVFMQKRESEGEPFVESKAVKLWTGPDTSAKLPVSSYYDRHPEHVLGRLSGDGEMHAMSEGSGEVTVHPTEEHRDLPASIRNIVAGFMADAEAFREGEAEQPDAEVAADRVSLDDAPEVARNTRVGNIFVHDGAIWTRERDHVQKTKYTTIGRGRIAPERVDAWIALRDLQRSLRDAQRDPDFSAQLMEELREELNDRYDEFVSAYGPLNSTYNRSRFRVDWAGTPEMLALEEWDAKAGKATKADIFRVRTQTPHREVTHTDSPQTALALSLQNRNSKVDLEYIGRLMGLTEEEAMEAISDRVFINPEGDLELREVYLSGNVRRKLAIARERNQVGQFDEQIRALEEVLPKDVQAGEITPTIGSAWIPPEVYADFIRDKTDVQNVTVQKIGTGGFALNRKKEQNADSPKNIDRYGVKDAMKYGDWDGVGIINAILRNDQLRVHYFDDDGRDITLQKETDAVQLKAELIRREFRDWVWEDGTRATELIRLYNDTFRSHVEPQIPDWVLSFDGMSDVWREQARTYQKEAAARIVMRGNTMLAHVVGAGKTFTMTTAAMEARRMKVWHKPVMVAPNHLVAQHAAEALSYYPGAKVLAATKDDFTPEARRTFFSRVSTGDWDLIIIPESSFKKMAMTRGTIDAYFQRQLIELEEYISEAEEGSPALKELERQRDMLTSRMEKMLKEADKDPGPYFEDLGIDALLVDEAHNFKNLFFRTKLGRVPGINPTGNQKTFDMLMKVDWLNELTGGKSVVFATGTPLTNSMGELWVMQRYLQPGTLQDAGVYEFDDWARTFGEVVQLTRVDPIGLKFRNEDRFARFVNLADLARMWSDVADVKTVRDIDIYRPPIAGGKPKAVQVDAHPLVRDFMTSLAYRAAHTPPDPRVDNILKIMTSGRKLAVDVRMLEPDAEPLPNSKLEAAANEIHAMYETATPFKGTQVVWLDVGVPRKAVKLSESEKQVGEFALRQYATEDEVSVDELYEEWVRVHGAKKNNRQAFRTWLNKIEQDVTYVIGEEEDEGTINIGGKDAPKVVSAITQIGPDINTEQPPPWNAYQEIKDQLVKRGVPAAEVQFVHDFETDAKKRALFRDMNTGDVRVLLASTGKLGTGANIQTRLVASHHIDAPWRPADLEQRDGRILRPGNLTIHQQPGNQPGLASASGVDLDGVSIVRYVAEATIDARFWQTLEDKQRFIEQFNNADESLREADDISSDAADMADLKALAAANPLFVEQAELTRRVKSLSGARSLWEASRARLQGELHSIVQDRLPSLREEADRLKAQAAAFAKQFKALPKGSVNVEIDGQQYHSPADAIPAIEAKVTELTKWLGVQTIDETEKSELVKTASGQQTQAAQIGTMFGRPLYVRATAGWRRNVPEGETRKGPLARAGNTFQQRQITRESEKREAEWEWSYYNVWLSLTPETKAGVFPPGSYVTTARRDDLSPTRDIPPAMLQELADTVAGADKKEASVREYIKTLEKRKAAIESELSAMKFEQEEEFAEKSERLAQVRNELQSDAGDALIENYVPSRELIERLGVESDTTAEMLNLTNADRGGQVGTVTESDGTTWEAYTGIPDGPDRQKREAATQGELSLALFPPKPGMVWIQKPDGSDGQWAEVADRKIRGAELKPLQSESQDDSLPPTDTRPEFRGSFAGRTMLDADRRRFDLALSGDQAEGAYGPTTSRPATEAPKKKRAQVPDWKETDPNALIRYASKIGLGGLMESTLETVSPATVGKTAEIGAQRIRRWNAERRQNNVRAYEELKKIRREFQKMPRDEQLSFMYRIEEVEDAAAGKFYPDDPGLDAMSMAMRKLLDDAREQVIGLGEGYLETYYKSYFPHLWRKRKEADSWVANILASNRLEGKKDFLKQRTIATLREGVEDHGLEPMSYNPAEMVYMRLKTIHDFLAAHRTKADLHNRGMVRFVYAKSKIPNGYKKINDDLYTVYGPPTITVKEAYDQLVVEQLMDLANSLGVKTERVMNTGEKDAWGYARDGVPARMVTKFGAPEFVAMHELGHILGYRYGLFDRMRRKGSDSREDVTHRKRVEREWNALADRRLEGEEDASEYYKRYVRQKAEKEALLLQAYLYAPDAFKETAPTLYEEFDAFIKMTGELTPLADIKPSLRMGESEGELDVPGLRIMGHYVAPEPVARLLNNHLAPGFRRSESDLLRGTYNGFRKANIALTMIRLGLSGFHATMTSLSTIGSWYSQSLRDISTGNPRLIAKGMGRAMAASTLAVPLASTIKRGTRLRALYRGRSTNPVARLLGWGDSLESDSMKTLLALAIEGGVAPEADPFYLLQSIDQLTKTLGDVFKDARLSVKLKGAAKLPYQVPMAAMEAVMKPILEWLVPAQKLGMWSMMVESEMDRLGTDDPMDPRLQLESQRIWDSVDNRLGQMVYDNIFWHTALKDIFFVNMQAFGWNKGFFREYVFGAAADTITTPARLKDGDALLSYRMSEVLGTALFMGIAGAMIQYLLGGGPPDEPKDVYFPEAPDIGKNPDGSPYRLSLPSYVKDYYAWFNYPVRTARHKLSPTIGILAELLANEDFYGTEIVGRDDDIAAKSYYWMEHVGKSFIPFSVRNYMDQREADIPAGKAALVSGLGSLKAPSYIARTRAHKLAVSFMVERMEHGTRTREDSEAAMRRSLIRNRMRLGHDYSKFTEGMSEDEISRLQKEAEVPAFASTVKRLSVDEAANVYAVANDTERAMIEDIVRDKWERERDNQMKGEGKLRESRYESTAELLKEVGLDVRTEPTQSELREHNATLRETARGRGQPDSSRTAKTPYPERLNDWFEKAKRSARKLKERDIRVPIVVPDRPTSGRPEDYRAWRDVLDEIRQFNAAL